MSLDLGTLVAHIKLDDGQYNRSVDGARAKLGGLKRDLATIGVTKARIDADSARASARIKEIKAELTGLDTKVKIDGVPTRETHDRIEALKAELASLSNVRVKLDVDASGAMARMKKVRAEIAALTAHDPTLNVKVKTEGVNFAFRGIGMLTTAIVGLGPTTVPVLATVAAGLGTVGSAALAAGGAVGIWGGVMKGALAAYKQDVDKLKALGKQLQTATDPAKIALIKSQMADIKAGWSKDEKQFDVLKEKFTGAFQAILKASGPATFGVLNSGMRVLMGVMPRLVPIINSVGGAISGLVGDLGKFSRTREFQGILDFFRIQGPAAITQFAHSAGNLLLGVFRLLQGFAPFQTSFLTGFEKMTRSFATWAGGFAQSTAFHQFMAYAAKILPEVRDLFVSLATFAGRFVTALAPIGSIELRVVTTFLDRLNQLPIGVLTAFAGAITAVVLGLKAWELAVKAMAVSDAITKVTGGAGKAMDDLRIRTLLAKDAFKVARTETGLLGSTMAGLKAGASEAGGAIKTAFRGAAGLAGIALLTTDTHKASNQINVLKDAAGAAAIGFSMGGPWGAAIGGAVGLLGGLFGASQRAKQAQKDLAAQAGSTANSVAATLDKQTGAITRNTVETAKNALANSGVYDAAKTLGVSLNDVTSAYLGNANAADRVGKRILAVRDAQGGEVNMSGKSKDAWDKINAAVFATGGSFASTRRHIQEVNGVSATFAGNAGASVTASDKLTTAQDKLKTATQNLNTQVQNEINKFTILRGDHLSQSAAADAMRTSVHDLTAALKTNHTAITANTVAGGNERQAIRNAASALNDKVTADFKANNSTKGYTKAMSIARAETEKGRQKLIDNITAVTGNRTAAKKYVDYLIKNPAHLKTDTPGMDAAKKNIKDLQGEILKLRGMKVSPEIAVSFRAAALVANAQGAKNRAPGALGRATGGPVFGAGSATSDSIPAMLSNNEHVWTAREVDAAGGHSAVEAIRGAVLRGRGLALAAGGPVVKVVGASSGLGKTEGAIAAAVRAAGRAAQAAERAAAAIGNGLHRPLKGGVLTQGIHDAYTGFPAIDLGAPIGTPVYAGASGRVAVSRDLLGNQVRGYRSYGRYIQLDNGRFSTLYAHLSRRLVQAGQTVSGGQRIGLSGDTGNTHGAHLHFGAKGISPMRFLHPSGGGGPLQPYNGRQGHLSPGQAQSAAKSMMPSGWSWPALRTLWNNESGWRWNADNPHSSAYGIPQALPGSKMGRGWHDNAIAQIRWGLDYIRGKYGTPSHALGMWRARSPHWYANGGPVIGSGTGTSDSILARLSNNEHVWTAQEVAGAGGHAAVQALRGYAKGGAATTAPASVTRQISAQITAMRNALDTSKFYAHLVPYIRRRLSGKQEETYLARAHKAFVSDLQRNAMDRIRSNTTALRHSANPNRDYAALTAFIGKHLNGREERDRLRMAKEALTADKKRLATEQARADATRARRLGGTTLNAIELGHGGSMATVIKHLTDLIRQDFNGRRERGLLGTLRHGRGSLTGIEARATAIDAALAARQHTRSTLIGQRNAVRSTFAGFGPNIADYAQSPGGILGGLRGQLASVRKFTSNIQRLRKLGYPNSIISQVIGLGLTDGIAASAQLIGLSRADRANVIGTFGRLDRVARSSGTALSNQMYAGGIKAADAQIAHLKARQKYIDGVFEHAAEALARRIARLLHIPVVRVKPRATHDLGGWLPTGASLTVNNTGRPEAVYNAQQQAQHDEDRAMMRKLIARYESGHTSGRAAPLIGSAVIRENVDLEKYERQRAFYERRTTV